MAHVELLTYTQFPEKMVASAARLCYSSSSIHEIQQGMTDEKTTHFMDILTENGHETPIEHASFTFG
ncbi:MAG TPA: thymidylate synthase (FAD), partial [Ruminococcaceae bacterium]|nr:thymidylate synthase (FAD) [Oscillospiraceae bacterium]